MRRALEGVARDASARVSLLPGDVVLDIGSNDGTLLSYYPTSLVRVGVEPAENLSTVQNYENQRLHCIRGFWDSLKYISWEDWQRIKPTGQYSYDVPKPKVITALGMFYDLEDPNQFIANVAKVLHPDGVFVAQLMCLKQTLENGDVGNFAHEHLEFYSLRSLVILLGNYGLQIESVEENVVNGGSYRLYVRHAAYLQDPSHKWNPESLFRASYDESVLKLDEPEAYRTFTDKITRTLSAVRSFVIQAKNDGKRVWIYGASTKGNVMLQYWGLGPALIEGAADKSPEKWGKYTVGTGIPIYNEKVFRERDPEYALVLPYSFADEFVARESEWQSRGGKFVIPLPEFRVV